MTKRTGNRRQSGQPTISDVAREAHCSPMTVSRVINGEDNVRAETRERVLEAIAKLKYTPNSAARSLAGASQLTKAGGVILFRIPVPKPTELADSLAMIILGRTDWAGHFSVVEPGRVRMRQLR